MSTTRSVVSRVRALHKLLSGDNIITDRVVASALNDNAKLLVKRETNLRKLWQTDTIFSTIPCLRMKQVPIAECCEYTSPINISRSRLKLPRIGEGNYQYLIQGVFSINNSKKLKEITISRYINLLKLQDRIKDVYYWIHDGYLYVTSEDVLEVKLIAYFEEDIPDEILYPTDSCDACKCTATTTKPCTNPLDNEFKCPGYLESQVIQMTSKELLETYHRLSLDPVGNDRDDTPPANPKTP